MDLVARELGISPADIRKRNALTRGDFLPVGQPIETEVFLGQTIDAVCDRAGPKPEPSGRRRAVGRGIASNIQSYGRLVWRNVPIEALGSFFGPKGKPVVRDLKADRVFPDFTFGTHLCDLEVDLDTGKVRLLRYLAAHDVGRAINPRSVEGQISGAVVQGLGMALLEEVAIEDGVNLTGGFFQYLIPTATDVPDI